MQTRNQNFPPTECPQAVTPPPPSVINFICLPVNMSLTKSCYPSCGSVPSHLSVISLILLAHHFRMHASFTRRFLQASLLSLSGLCHRRLVMFAPVAVCHVHIPLKRISSLVCPAVPPMAEVSLQPQSVVRRLFISQHPFAGSA